MLGLQREFTFGLLKSFLFFLLSFKPTCKRQNEMHLFKNKNKWTITISIMYLLCSDKCYKSIWKTLYTNLARETWMRSYRLYTSTRRTSKILYLNLKLFILFTRELLFVCLLLLSPRFGRFNLQPSSGDYRSR